MLKRLLIPKDRIAVLIGRRGSIKRKIQSSTNTKIAVEDDVQIEGDALDVLLAESMITAIGRGFAPESAMELLDEEKTLAVINLPTDERVLKRVRSRIIGTRGKTRRNLEDYTKTSISVYGKTVAIIGTYENTDLARQAAEKIIKGLAHKTVYKFLEDERRREKLEGALR